MVKSSLIHDKPLRPLVWLKVYKILIINNWSNFLDVIKNDDIYSTSLLVYVKHPGVFFFVFFSLPSAHRWLFWVIGFTFVNGSYTLGFFGQSNSVDSLRGTTHWGAPPRPIYLQWLVFCLFAFIPPARMLKLAYGWYSDFTSVQHTTQQQQICFSLFF